MELGKLENEIQNETMKYKWIYLKMEFETFKDGVGNIGKLNWKYWKMELETLENGIGKIGK